MVIEAGVVAGYLIAWVVRKARRAAGRLDGVVDAAVDGYLDRLEGAVTAKLGGHPVLAELAEEAAADESGGGQVSELTRQQVELAITAAARKDDEFGRTVTELVAELRRVEQVGGGSVVAGAGSVVLTEHAHAHADGGGIAVGKVGRDMYVDKTNTGKPDPPVPGRSSR